MPFTIFLIDNHAARCSTAPLPRPKVGWIMSIGTDIVYMTYLFSVFRFQLFELCEHFLDDFLGGLPALCRNINILFFQNLTKTLGSLPNQSFQPIRILLHIKHSFDKIITG